MPASHVISNVSQPQLVRLAEEIAFAARPGDLIALCGGLGAGNLGAVIAGHGVGKTSFLGGVGVD